VTGVHQIRYLSAVQSEEQLDRSTMRAQILHMHNLRGEEMIENAVTDSTDTVRIQAVHFTATLFHINDVRAGKGDMKCWKQIPQTLLI